MTYAFVFSWLFFCMFLCLLICFLRFSHVFLLQRSVKLTLIENILLLISSVFMAYRLYDFVNYSFRLALVQRRHRNIIQCQNMEICRILETVMRLSKHFSLSNTSRNLKYQVALTFFCIECCSRDCNGTQTTTQFVNEHTTI